MDPDPGFFFYGGSDPFVEKVDSLISVMKSLYSRISNEGKKIIFIFTDKDEIRYTTMEFIFFL